METIYIPLDFNSLAILDGSTLKLSAYYIDYAFSSESVELADGMRVTFYDKFWTPHPGEIACLDAVLKKDAAQSEPWIAEVRGPVYVSNDVPPQRNYCSRFIGANTFVLSDGKKSNPQKLGSDPGKDKLGGVNVFCFAPGSELPNFMRIIGMDAPQLHEFFRFSDIRVKPPTKRLDGSYTDDTLLVRGGSKSEASNT